MGAQPNIPARRDPREPSAREEEYRRRSFERVGLYDVAAMSMALRRLTSPVRRSSTPNAA